MNTNYRDRLRNLRPLNRVIVFILGLLLSSLGTLSALMLLCFIQEKSDIMDPAGYIIGLAVITSALLFFFSRLHKTSIRFSTLWQLNGIFLLLTIKCLGLSSAVLYKDFLI